MYGAVNWLLDTLLGEVGFEHVLTGDVHEDLWLYSPQPDENYLVADYLPLKCILQMHGISDCHFSNNASGVNCTSAKHESSLEESYGLCPPQ